MFTRPMRPRTSLTAWQKSHARGYLARNAELAQRAWRRGMIAFRRLLSRLALRRVTGRILRPPARPVLRRPQPAMAPTLPRPGPQPISPQAP